MREARLSVLDDGTPLDGTRIDVGVRVGWTLRMARVGAGADGPLSLEEMAGRVDSNPTRLHRVETGKLRSGRVADAYEAVLGLPPASLRAPVDVICRGFPYAFEDRDPGPSVTSVRTMSRLTERVSAPGATGGDWLAWARALSQPGAIGLPEWLAEQRIRTLVSELLRSTSHGYPSRYEALSSLRCSGYGYLVLAVAQDVASDPHVQVLYDLMSAVGEHVTPDAVRWCLELLDQDRERLVIGAALALENMAEINGDPAFWAELVEPLVECFERHLPGSVQDEWVSHLLRLAPPSVLAGSSRTPRRRLARAAEIPDWSRTRLNRHWSDCQRRAHAVTEALGLPDQPLLARLLFDIAMGPHETRAVTSYMLLGALPHLRGPVGEHIADLAERHPDPVVRDRAGRRLSGTLYGEYSEVADRWLSAGTPEERDRGLMLAGAAGREVPEPLLRTALADGAAGPPLFAAGMAAHPVLPALASDETLSAEVRGGARWWLGQGARITT